MAEDPRPQSEITNSGQPNARARKDAYTDTAITTRSVTQTTEVPDLGPAKSGSTTLGNIRPVYAADKVEEIEQDATNPSAPDIPHSPNSWQNGRDPYKVNGLDPYHRNQNT